MKKADVVGRRVVDVKQIRTTDKIGHQFWNVQAIYFDNGSVLILNVCELGCDYGIEGTVYSKKEIST